MCDSGLPEFPRADDLTLYEGMRVAARSACRSRSTPRAKRSPPDSPAASAPPAARDVRAFLASRPVLAEVEAIQRAALLAREAGAWLHIVHVSSGRGVARSARSARPRRRHLPSKPARTTSSSPKRTWSGSAPSPSARRRLRPPPSATRCGSTCCAATVDIDRVRPFARVARMKSDADFFRVWGGIAGVQSTSRCCSKPAITRAGLRCAAIARWPPKRRPAASASRGKGEIATGLRCRSRAGRSRRAVDALAPADLQQRHPTQPLHRLAHFAARSRRTLLRGADHLPRRPIVAGSRGRFVRPVHPGVLMHQLGQTRSASPAQSRPPHARHVRPRAAAGHAQRHGDRPRRARAGGAASRNTPSNSSRAAVSARPRRSAFVYVLEGELVVDARTEAARARCRRATPTCPTARCAYSSAAAHARAAVIEKPYQPLRGVRAPEAAASATKVDVAGEPLHRRRVARRAQTAPGRSGLRFRREHHDLPARRDPADGRNPRHGARPADARRRRHLPAGRLLVSRSPPATSSGWLPTARSGSARSARCPRSISSTRIGIATR